MNAPVMRYASVPDGMGGRRHILVPADALPAPTKRAKKKRHVPDPLKAMNGNDAAEQLKLYIERYERLDEEAQSIAADKKDVLSEARSVGFDTKAIKTIVALRRLEPHVRQEAEGILETYKASLGLA